MYLSSHHDDMVGAFHNRRHQSIETNRQIIKLKSS